MASSTVKEMERPNGGQAWKKLSVSAPSVIGALITHPSRCTVQDREKTNSILIQELKKPKP